MKPPNYIFNQKASIITLSLTAALALTLLAFNLTTPSGSNTDEMMFMGTLTIMLIVLIPLYLKKVNWGWAAGTTTYLGLYLGAAKEALDGVLHFSTSPYNIGVIIFYLVATVGIIFSLMSLRETPQTQLKTAATAVTGTILVAAVMGAFILPTYSNDVSWYMGESSIDTIRETLETMDSLEEKIRHLIDTEKIPSLVAGIVVDDELIWNRGWGASSEDTIYPIDSITKTFTATAIMQLHENSLIDLDTDANQHLTFTLRHPDYPDKPITPRMLLSHQSGLGHATNHFDDYTLGQEFLDYMNEHSYRPIDKSVRDAPKEQFFENLVNSDGSYYTEDVWTTNEPGTTYSYSNIGYDILTLIVENITGQPYTEYLQEHILDPLDMTSTVLTIHEQTERQAPPHERMYGVLSKTMVELPLYGRTMHGAGGIRTTVKDLSKFMIAHMNDGTYLGHQLLRPETVRLMRSVQAEIQPGNGDAFQTAEGLGLSLLTDETWRYWGHEYNMHGAAGHGGSNPGSRSSMWFTEDEDGGYGVIILTNHKQTYKPDNGVYAVSVYLTIQQLLMEEAHERHLEPDNT